MEYKGFDIRWRGWFPNQVNGCLVGQWVATKIGEDNHYYSTTNGFVGSVERRRSFDLTLLSDVLNTWEHLTSEGWETDCPTYGPYLTRDNGMGPAFYLDNDPLKYAIVANREKAKALKELENYLIKELQS